MDVKHCPHCARKMELVPMETVPVDSENSMVIAAHYRCNWCGRIYDTEAKPFLKVEDISKRDSD